MLTLSTDELAMLDFEAGWWKYPGAKDEEIRQRFDIPSVRYYQRLNELIDRPEAMEARPQIVKRLRRIRDRRRRRPASLDLYPR